MRRALLVLVAAVLLATPATAVAQPETLRSMLESAGYGDAIVARGGPDRDRPVTSAGYGMSSTAFVAAYYFTDEVAADGGLRRLHVSGFDRVTRRWSSPPIAADVAGSVQTVDLMPGYAFVGLHVTPSAGWGLVFSLSPLKHVSDFWGDPLAVFADRSILFIPGVPHFAAEHVHGVSIRNAAGADTEIFPGSMASPMLAEFKRKVATASAADQADLERSGFNVDDVNREIEAVAWSNDGRRLAFAALYAGAHLGLDELAPVYSGVICTRTIGWSCEERPLEQYMRTGELTRDERGVYADSDLRELTRRMIIAR